LDKKDVSVTAENIIHQFIKSNFVLRNVFFHMKKGEVFGLLGHNGSGKTTTFNILAGIIVQTSGILNIFGK
jgi:ABC-2 type transport system ATP-binding protein